MLWKLYTKETLESHKLKNSHKKTEISVILPIYGCIDCLNILYQRLTSVLEELVPSFEIIMVNDSSPDNSWSVISTLASSDTRVKGVNLSRNFSQHRAIVAGMDIASGNWIVVMDCDLQDPPEEIPRLYNEAVKGYDIVFALRKNRKDSWFKDASSKVFTATFNYLTDLNIGQDVTNFSIISSKVQFYLNSLRDQSSYYIANLFWLGFEKKFVYVEHAQREHGKSSYTLRKLLYLAFDSIISHSNKPLKLIIKFGFMLSFISLLFTLWLVFRYFFMEIPIAGWTSVMVSLYFIGGILLVNLGFIGLYIAKTFDEQKKRPLYIIKDLVNIHSHKLNLFEERLTSD